MAVTSASEGGIFRAASGVMLNRDARPVVHGVGEPVMASLSSYHYAAFARPLGDRRDPCQTEQGGSGANGASGAHLPVRERHEEG